MSIKHSRQADWIENLRGLADRLQSAQALELDQARERARRVQGATLAALLNKLSITVGEESEYITLDGFRFWLGASTGRWYLYVARNCNHLGWSAIDVDYLVVSGGDGPLLVPEVARRPETLIKLADAVLRAIDCFRCAHAEPPSVSLSFPHSGPDTPF